MKRILISALLAAFLPLAGCGGISGIPSASRTTAVGAPVPMDTRVPTEEDDTVQEEEDDDAATHLAVLRSLLDDAKQTLTHDEWLAFIDAIGVTDNVARALLIFTEDERIELTSATDHMPVVDLDATVDRYERMLTGIRHIGADVAPLPAGSSCDMSGENTVANARWCDVPLPYRTLRRIGNHGDVMVSHGRLRDGVGREKVVEWLKRHAIDAQEWGPGFPGLPIHPKPLILRIVEGASKEQVGLGR